MSDLTELFADLKSVLAEGGEEARGEHVDSIVDLAEKLGLPATNAVLSQLAALIDAQRPQKQLFDYWGPRGLMLDYPHAPTPDDYRLVGSDKEADDAIAAGEYPLHGHRGMKPEALEHQRLLQWEGPNRIFGVTKDGRVEILDDPDTTAQPVWNSETGGGEGWENRRRILEHLRRTAPEMLERPAGIDMPPAGHEMWRQQLEREFEFDPNLDLGARTSRLPALGEVARRLMAGGESILENNFEMQDRARAQIPSQREGDIAVPDFYRPGQGYPMPSVVPWDSGPTTPPFMPMLPPPSSIPQTPVQRTDDADLVSAIMAALNLYRQPDPGMGA